MKTFALEEAVSDAFILNGRVLVRMWPELAETDAHLGAGSISLPLVPVTEPLRPDEIPFRAVFDMTGDREVARGLRVNLNVMEDWCVPGLDTLQVYIADFKRPHEIEVGEPLTIPPRTGPLAFRAALASHRARATLRLRILDDEGRERKSVAIPFDAKRIGGRELAGYQQVSIPLPGAGQSRRVTATLVYEGTVEPDEEEDPFVFVVSPEIVSAGTLSGLQSAVVFHGPPSSRATWHEARVPARAVGRKDQIAIVWGNARIPLFTAVDATVEVIEDHGHTVLLRASAPARLVAHIHGAPAMAIQLGPDPRALRVPDVAQTGEPTLLQLRDPSGTQVVFETYFLPPRLLTPLEVLQREQVRHIPGHLFTQSVHRYRALRAHAGDQRSAGILPQLPAAIATLEGGYDRVKLGRLVFPDVREPDVSVVIPAHNKVKVTYYCLCGLLLAWNEASFEVIVVDDGSSDETAEIESFVEGIRVVRNQQPQRFIRACNAGVAEARGRYVVLLNNDTEPTAGWLDALIDAFHRFPRVGLAGSKLLFPDGRLQDAGGIVWGSGNPWNYGSRQNPWEPRFSYARQADYLSGAALMTTRAIWDQVGGLSSYLEPMYFEDTDLSFKVREAGYTTWFVPRSIVFHHEGMTSGTDTSIGFKRFQEVNRPKFKRRWAKDFARFGQDGVNPDLEKDRGILGRVLFIDYTTPRADQDAGSYAALQEIRLVQSLGYKVTFLPENLAHFGNYTEDLERDGVEVIYAPFYLSPAEFLEKRGSEFDAFYVTRYHVAANVIDQIRAVAPKAKVLLNNADLHFLRHLRTGLAMNDQARIAQAAAIREMELAVMRRVDVVLSYTDVEHSVIQSHTDGQVKVMACPWVVEVPAALPPLSGRAGISFLGSFRHHPNVEGIEWFCRQVMPLVEQADPDLVLSIYGSGMNDEVRRLKSDRIDPVGFVESVADAYDRHRVFVAPLLSGAGIKGKVVAALAHGIPCVLSPTAAEGIGIRNRNDCFVASTPEEWAEAIVRLNTDDALWQRIATNAREHVEETFSFRRGRELMRAAFEAVDMYGPVE